MSLSFFDHFLSITQNYRKDKLYHIKNIFECIDVSDCTFLFNYSFIYFKSIINYSSCLIF